MDYATLAALDLIDMANALTYAASSTDNPFMTQDFSTTYLSATSMILESLYGLVCTMVHKDLNEYELGFFVYCDLIFRGFDPFDSWLESGLCALYPHDPTPFAPGNYYVVPAEGFGYHMGMMVSSGQLLTFDCQFFELSSRQKALAQVIDGEDLPDLLDSVSDILIENMRSRHDTFEHSALGLVWKDGPFSRPST